MASGLSDVGGPTGPTGTTGPTGPTGPTTYPGAGFAVSTGSAWDTSFADPLIVAHGGTGNTALTPHGVLVGNAAGAANATSAGTAGQVLTSGGASADPTFQANVRWASTYLAGSWFPTGTVANNQTTAGGVNATLVAVPFLVTSTITISDLGVRIGTLSVAGNVQAAIYANASGKPTGTALAVTGSMSTTLGVAVSADITGADVQLPPGLYWFAVNADNATVRLTGVGGAASALTYQQFFVGTTTLANAFPTGGLNYSIAQTFGTWPDLTGAAVVETATPGPLGVFKVASVP